MKLVTPQPAVPILGQPLTLHELSLPVNAVLTCNCGEAADTRITIIASAAAQCPGCRKIYNATYDPSTGQVKFAVAVEQKAQVTQ